MSIYAFLLLGILIYVYVSYYYRYPPNTKILQSESGKLDSNLLYEKHPIILLNNQKTLLELKKEYFTYLISANPDIKISEWNKNKYKYLLIQPTESCEIHTLPANKKLTDDETLITLQLNPTQVLILPLHWNFYTDTYVNTLGIQDYISYFLP